VVAEVLRSGAYCDEIVMNYVNRRFAATWYDYARPESNYGDGFAYDPDADQVFGPIWRDPALRPRPKNGGMTREGRVFADSYPAAVFVTPEGEKLGDVLWGIIPPEAFLKALKDLVAAHPKLFPVPAEEQEVVAAAAARPGDARAGLRAAKLAWELADFESCLARIGTALAACSADEGGLRAELLCLRGRVEVCMHASEAAIQTFDAALPLAAASAHNLSDDLAVYRARALMQLGRYEEAEAALHEAAESHQTGDRLGDALYYRGLALWRLGKKDAARKVWRHHRTTLPRDRLARRSAASLGLKEAEAFLNQELLERDGWW
jgi:tetratricopeptide (TPR) repeat protein